MPLNSLESTFYTPDLLLCAGLAAVIAFLLVTFLPKLMYKSDEPLPELPKSFGLIAPLLAAGVATALYFVTNATPIVIVLWSIVAAYGAVIAVVDFKFHRAPNVLNVHQFVLVLIAVLTHCFVDGNWSDLMWFGIALVAGLVWFIGAYAFRIHAFGDVKYMPTVVAALAFANIWLAVAWMVFGYIFAMVFGIIELIGAKKERGPKSQLKGALVPPFYLALAALPFVISVGLVAGA